MPHSSPSINVHWAPLSKSPEEEEGGYGRESLHAGARRSAGESEPWEGHLDPWGWSVSPREGAAGARLVRPQGGAFGEHLECRKGSGGLWAGVSECRIGEQHIWCAPEGEEGGTGTLRGPSS